MINKFLGVLLLAAFSLNASTASDSLTQTSEESLNACYYGHKKSHRSYGLRSYALFSNQVQVLSGTNVPWSPTTDVNNSPSITVDPIGNITLPDSGTFLVQYTVRLTKTPFNGTSTATVQLQQTLSGVPTNITQSAITSNTSIDGLSSEQPSSQTQIVGYAIVQTGSASNVINLAVNITGGNLTIPPASGIDANAEIVILQLN